MADVSLIDALTMAMAWELEHDPRVIILGEDVGVNGGVFRATAGLQKRFGADRLRYVVVLVAVPAVDVAAPDGDDLHQQRMRGRGVEHSRRGLRHAVRLIAIPAE